MNVLSEESRYFLYLLEQYALNKGITGKQALDLFESKNIVEYIYSMYFTYHTERVENAIDDIDQEMNKEETSTTCLELID
ncbi:MAG: DUF3791 domain-containing protein [Leptospirales bacterium]|nr:DUF3791 domain-containing protein [Leptospirales bacterium]